MDELLNQLLDKKRYTLNEIVNNFQKDIKTYHVSYINTVAFIMKMEVKMNIGKIIY